MTRWDGEGEEEEGEEEEEEGKNSPVCSRCRCPKRGNWTSQNRQSRPNFQSLNPAKQPNKPENDVIFLYCLFSI